MESDGLKAVLLANRDRRVRFLRAHGAGDAAEDLLQELWLKLSTAPGGPISHPLPYLYRAANNLMLDRYRSTRQSVLGEQSWSETQAPANVTEPPSGASPAWLARADGFAMRAVMSPDRTLPEGR